MVLTCVKKLQNKKATSHIPIILLTAKNTTKSKLMGLKSGAIEYIRKPFNINELLLKINNIIISKQNTLAKFKTDLISLPKNEVMNSRNDIFIGNLVKELDAQLENCNFKLEDLSKTMHMSYSVIYRNCLEITGKTLHEFVRSYRIKSAALLMVKQGYKISEAAFMVGYKDSNHFTKSFKNEFGKTPSVFKKESQKLKLPEFLEQYNLQE